ncbi:hypothetical protein MSTE_00115 [Mycobacteroides stephanolepidis]|uniref:Uncharacterized protein n=1 Tax=[Mycobacterium] stephanolepidis TaxID=1520670 RepID=A0A1Z4ER82_9MYCO|nr:hypothetical protein MSTE_00115 [[Mycobacterium] stephanolepidis]
MAEGPTAFDRPPRDGREVVLTTRAADEMCAALRVVGGVTAGGRCPAGVHGLYVAVSHVRGGTDAGRPACHCAFGAPGFVNRPRCARTAQTTTANQRPPTRLRSSSWRPFPHSSQSDPASMTQAAATLPSDHRFNDARCGSPRGGVCASTVTIAQGTSPRRTLPSHLLAPNAAAVTASPVPKYPRRRRRVASRGSDGHPWPQVAVILLTVHCRGFTAGQRGCPADDHTCGRCSSI